MGWWLVNSWRMGVNYCFGQIVAGWNYLLVFPNRLVAVGSCLIERIR